MSILLAQNALPDASSPNALAFDARTAGSAVAPGYGKTHRDNTPSDTSFKHTFEAWLDKPIGTQGQSPVPLPNTAMLPPGPHSYANAAPQGPVPLREESGQLNLSKALPRKRQRR